MKNLIVGAGLSGCALANKIAAELNEDVLIIDKRNHIAGNIYDYKDIETGITVHKYGPHIFHTNNKEVWDFLSQFTKWHPFFFKPNTVIEGNIVTLPFNLKTLYELFPDETAAKIETKLINTYGFGTKISISQLRNNNDTTINFIANYIYENVYKHYTEKQWGTNINDINSSVINRLLIHISNDCRYFQDKFQAIPLNGYTKMIENMLNHPNIEVNLETEFKDINTSDFSRIIYTGSIDELFNYKYGLLPYRSLIFDTMKINKEYFLKSAMTTFPNNYNFTRITEHKYFLDEKASHTIVTFEYPTEYKTDKNERYYPINNEKTLIMYNKYLNEVHKKKNLFVLGRLGNYKYYNMDTIVENAINLFKEKIKWY